MSVVYVCVSMRCFFYLLNVLLVRGAAGRRGQKVLSTIASHEKTTTIRTAQQKLSSSTDSRPTWGWKWRRDFLHTTWQGAPAASCCLFSLHRPPPVCLIGRKKLSGHTHSSLDLWLDDTDSSSDLPLPVHSASPQSVSALPSTAACTKQTAAADALFDLFFI